MTNDTSDTIRAHVYHTRFDIDHEEHPEASERARDIRSTFIDFESIDLDDLHTVYEYIGETDINGIGMGALEDAYRDAQETGEARSMMVGDLIIFEDNRVYAVDRRGFARLESLEAELNEQEAEDKLAEEAAAKAEIAAERRMEKKLARHVDEHGWF